MIKNSIKVKLNSMKDVAFFIDKCSLFDVDIDYKVDRYVIDAKSLMGILSISLGREAIVTINTDDKRMIDTFIDELNLWIVEG